MSEDEEPKEDDHELVRELFSLWDQINQPRMLETWHDSQQIREEALDLFSLGLLDLKTRAQIERLFWSITKEIHADDRRTETHSGRIALFTKTTV